MSDAVPVRHGRVRVGDLVRCTHPKQAVFFGVLVGALAAWDGRPVREVAAAAAAVLLVQLSLGIDNDIADAQHDYRAQTSGKPVSDGRLESSDVSYWMMVLILAAVPVAVLNGAVAGAALLATLPIGWVHNHWLHRTAFSFLAWMLSFALIPAFLAYGGWAGKLHGDAPTWAVTGAAAAVGLFWHLATSVGDLVDDNKSGARNLPLRLALRLGAPRLLWLSMVLGAAAVAGLVVAVLTTGLRQ